MIEDQDLKAKLGGGRYLRFVLLSFNLNGNIEIKVGLCVVLQHNTVEPGILIRHRFYPVVNRGLRLSQVDVGDEIL